MIYFQTSNVDMPDLDLEKTFRWLEMVAADYGMRIGNVNYLFCSDADILDANRKYLGHDYYTDIITFDYTHGDKVSGDIYLSLDTVRSNAEEFGEPYGRELLRVIAHGVLHLCGINDKGPGERERMEAAEEKALAFWQAI